jgi:hypothetical protein
LGEVVWDSKGCNLTITKGEDTWLITMYKHDQEEGEEHIVEMVSTKWTEENSVNIIRIGPTLAPGLKRTVTMGVVLNGCRGILPQKYNTLTRTCEFNIDFNTE